MDFKKKLIMRLRVATVYIILGIVMIFVGIIIKAEEPFISSFGFALTIIGIARVRNYLIITKSEESIKKQKIRESDERNVAIANKAKSVTFSIYVMLLCVATIILSLLNMQEIARWLGFSVCALITIYWITYFIIRKKS